MSTLAVRLNSKSKRPFSGHRVSASFFFKFTGEDVTSTLEVPGKVTVVVDNAGYAALELPAKETLVPEKKIIIGVTAPDGQELASQEAAIDAVDREEPVAITVDPKEFFPIQRNTDQAFLKPDRIRGLLIDPTGKNRVGGKQVILFARSASDSPLQVVAVTRSDGRGYFSAPFPLGNFVAAVGAVGGGEQTPIRLQDDGSFPDRFVLGVGAATEEPTTDEEPCACEALVPRDPDADDLVNSPTTYSTDRGEGKCVDITKPNRVLQEFDFHAIVRSTEPQIRGLTVREPPKVGIDDIIRIIDPKIANFAVRALPQTTTGATRTPGTSIATRAALLGSASTEAQAKTRGLGNVDPDGVVEIALEDSRAELNHLGEAIGLAALKAARTPVPSGQSPLEDVRIEAEIVKTLARDPDGFSLTRLATAEILTRKNDLLRVVELIKRRTPSRGNLSCENSIDWDDEPTFYQACTIAHGHILHFKQQWVADGYSLGDLLYSLPLAPCQKKQIVTIDWDHRQSAARRESLDEQEFLSAQLSRDRDISEMADAFVRERISGGSEASTSSFGGGFGIGAIIPPVGGLLGIGGGTSSANSSAFQNSSRSTSANSLQQLRDRVNQAANAVRSQRSTVIQTVNQGESMRVQTEFVANHNHCHAITMEYFEVLRHFLVRHTLADVQECLLVPLLMSRFDSAKARRWREPLYNHLRDQRLRRGFDALQRIADNYVGSDMPVGSYAEEELVYLDGYLRIQFRIQRPRDNTDGTFLEAAWTPLSWLGLTPNEFWKSFLEGQLERDRIFAEILGPRISEEITNGLRFFAVDENNSETLLPIDSTLVSDFRNDQPLQVTLRLNANLPALRRDRIKFIRIGTTIDTNAGPRNIDTILPLGSKIIVHSGQMGYRTPHLAHDLFNQSRILNDLSGTDGVLIFTPLSRQELRKPREEDKEFANSLLKHLNDHIEHYHRAVWVSMDAQRRYMLLDGFIAPNSGGRSVGSVVENRLVGIVGNCLVLPVARGFHLDPTFGQDEENPIDLLDHYQPTTPIAPLRLAVPTKGVFAESVMGNCNSCEKKDESRFWRFEESPCPGEPTAIQPVSTESRRSEPPDLTPSPFPAPIVAFQNVPGAPDPQGFGGLLQLLSKPDLFRDISGLTENQKNALAGLQAALGTAQFFGGKAADLALQANMNKDIDKALDKINEQHQAGALNDDQRSKLTEAALRTMIGGGTESPASSSLTKEPEVKDAIRKATATPGGEVNITRATDNSTETFGVRTPTTEDVKRSFIIEKRDLTPERRAFNPRARDKSGRVRLSVRVPSLPAGGTIRWSVPPSHTGSLSLSGDPAVLRNTQTGASVDVIGLRPGLTELDVEARDSGGTVVESQKFPICVPQFVTVDVDGATFDPILTSLQLDVNKSDVLQVAKQVCDLLLSEANVRTVWLMAPFSETLPTQFAAGGIAATRVTRAMLRGEDPADLNYGLTSAGAGGIGPTDFDETIDVFAGEFDDPVSGSANEDIDEVTNEIVSVLLGSPPASSPERQIAINIVGRLFGETLAHEVVHSLIGATLSAATDPFHNAHPGVPGDLMNFGNDRSFQNRTGFELLAQVSTADFSQLHDHGIGFINIPTGDSKAQLDANFPVPPEFT
jgi:hypothetical protein